MTVNHSSKELRKFFNGGLVVDFGKKELITDIASSDDSFYLLSGYVKSYIIEDDGSLYTLYIYGPDDIFPLIPTLRSVFGQKLYERQELIYFEAMTEVVVARQRQNSMQNFVESKLKVHGELIERLLDMYEIYLGKVESSAIGLARQQVAHELLTLAGRFGNEYYGQTILEVPLTHQDLAECMGMARETVSRELEMLMREKVIATKDKHIIILNTDSLASVVYG